MLGFRVRVRVRLRLRLRVRARVRVRGVRVSVRVSLGCGQIRRKGGALVIVNPTNSETFYPTPVVTRIALRYLVVGNVVDP